MKINKSKAFKKQKSKRGGVKSILKPLSPSQIMKAKLGRPNQSMFPERSLSQNSSKSLNISGIIKGEYDENKPRVYYDLLDSPRVSPQRSPSSPSSTSSHRASPKKSQSSNRSSQGSLRSLPRINSQSSQGNQGNLISNQHIISPGSQSSQGNLISNQHIINPGSPGSTGSIGSQGYLRSKLSINSQGSPGRPGSLRSHNNPYQKDKPIAIAYQGSPNATSRQDSPKVTSRQVSPKVTSRQVSPKATSRQGSPNVTSNDGIIIKRPILSYDKVNQRDLLIYLDTCNSEYKSFEKNYYDNYKTKIYRDKITYFTRINTDYYQDALSYNGFIRFARSLLNTGDNLPQDHDVKAKKKELREMLKNFEDYLNKQILINKANGYNVPDRIYHPELKVILDIAKEIINKINALYGSKLRQSYLNNRNRGISKLKKVPGKLQDVSVAAVQYFYDKLFKNTDPPDRLGWNVNNYESRTAAKAKSQSKSGLFKKEKK